MKNIASRLIGIDPGTNVLGFAVVDIVNRELRLRAIDVLRMDRRSDHTQKLAQLTAGLGEVLERHRPSEMAIEAPFYGKNIQSMLKLGRAQGAAMATALIRGISIAEYAPRKIKQSITGNGNASKEQVAAMLAQILRADLSGAALDATDALAVAVCHHFQRNRPGGRAGKGSYKGWKGFLSDNPDRLA